MAGPNRTKVFATQTQTYSNPNTTGLLRVGYVSYPSSNNIPGAPNNTSGPFAYGIPNPFDCSNNDIIDGGALICGTYANPCTNEIVQTTSTSATICNPASASDVPGSEILCWNNNVQTWFPRQRYIMNNSTDKWPYNYKGFVSAIKPGKPCPPILYLENITINNANVINNNNNNIATKNNGSDSTILISNKELVNLTPLNMTTLMDTNTSLYDDTLLNTPSHSDAVLNNILFGNQSNNLINLNALHNIHISWNPNYHHPIDSFNIYINYKFHKKVQNRKIFKYLVPNIQTRGIIITLTNVSNGEESGMSNPIFFNPIPIDNTPFMPTNKIETDCCSNLNNIINNLDKKIDDINYNVININNSLDEQLLNMSNVVKIQLNAFNNTCQSLTSLITDLLATSSSILNKVNAIKCCDCSGSGCSSDASCNCDIYNNIFASETIMTINEYVLTYIATIHEDTDIYIPIDTFDELNAKLLTLSDIFALDPSCCFVNVFDIYKNMLKIVKTAFDNKILAKTALINSEKWKQDSALLHDPEKLKEYVNALSKSFYLINLTVSSSKAMIKRQYAIYHEMYGIPDKLAYDPFLMKPILVSLGIA
jgi:hypothetical protein